MIAAIAERELGQQSPPEFYENNHLPGFILYLRDLRENWRREGLPFNWRDLPNTGFQIETQLNLLPSDRAELGRWLSQTEQDIKGFTLEYLAQGLVFPIFYRINTLAGRVTAPLYGDKNIEDTVSEKERNGSVKRAIRAVKEFFVNEKTPEGALVVMTSPSGWSGLSYGGQEIVYSDSQTYIFQKRGKEIVGFTVRTDFSLAEHRELLKRLCLQDVVGENSPIEKYVDNIATIIPSGRVVGINDVVGVMRNIRGSKFAYKDRLWDEVYQDLQRRDELWRFDQTTRQFFDEFKEYILSNDLSREEVKEALAATVLRIAKFLRKDKQSVISYPSDIPTGRILEEVQRLPGCAGGGNTKLVNSITPRHGEISGVIGKMECVKCPFCDKLVDALLTEDKIICPKCNQSADRK